MSNEIRLLRPASWPKCAAAITPAAGPDSTMRHGMRVASVHEMMPPFDCIMCSGHLDARRRERIAHALEVRGDARPEIRVHRRRARALVLAILRIDVARNRHEALRQHFARDLACPLLVRGVPERKQEADAERFDAFGGERFERLPQCGFIERRHDRALRVDALRNAEGQMSRHERRRLLVGLIEKPVALVALDLEQVAKTFGHQEPRCARRVLRARYSSRPSSRA